MMQYVRCLNSDCKYYQEERCTRGLVTLDAFGLCKSEVKL